MGGESRRRRQGHLDAGPRGRGPRAVGERGGRIQCVSFCSSRPASHWLHSGFSATTKRRLVLVSLCAWKSLQGAGEAAPRGWPRPGRSPAPTPPLTPPLASPGAVSAVDDGVVGGVHRAEVVLGLLHHAAAFSCLGTPLGLRGVCRAQSASAPLTGPPGSLLGFHLVQPSHPPLSSLRLSTAM